MGLSEVAARIADKLWHLEEILLRAAGVPGYYTYDTTLSLNDLRAVTHREGTFGCDAQRIAATARGLASVISRIVDLAPPGTLTAPTPPAYKETGARAPATFHGFGKLPFELRTMIWKAAALPIACPLYQYHVRTTTAPVFRKLAASSLLPDRGLWAVCTESSKAIKSVYEKNRKLLAAYAHAPADDMTRYYRELAKINIWGRRVQDDIRTLASTFPITYTERLSHLPSAFDNLFAVDNDPIGMAMWHRPSIDEDALTADLTYVPISSFPGPSFPAPPLSVPPPLPLPQLASPSTDLPLTGSYQAPSSETSEIHMLRNLLSDIMF